MHQVLIVGAGPVGLTMAMELARYGVPARVIDRSAHPTETSKALVVWSRTLELLDRAGCTPAFLAAGLRAHGITMHDGAAELGHAEFDTIASGYAFALMIPQSETERLLAAHLATLGVTVEREVELVSFTPSEGSVSARLRHLDGREESVETPWLIGCDGAHSTVRHGLGLPFPGVAQPDDWMLADVRLEGARAPAPDRIATYLHRDGPVAVFPMPGGRSRVIATVGTTDPAHPRPDPTLAQVQALVDARTDGAFRASDPRWLANFHINERKVADYRVGRVFLAGDAAHVHSPAGGQGMNTGMQDAIALAWRLALVARGLSPALLEGYSGERSTVGKMVLRNASRLTDLATLVHPAALAARNLAMRFLLGLHVVQDRMTATMSEIEIGYPDSPLSVGRGAGRRFAPEHDDGPPPGAGDDPRFVAYAQADDDEAARLVAAFPTLVQPRVRRSPDRDRLMIVRPDGYVGLSARRAAWPEAEAYLAKLSGVAATGAARP